ncbi:MAG: hypothetical protein D6808_03130 [Candidatus Dadabacteria bacterium]|nr:MAG: hypothetical protein D6808_03130 [Candidatus Dadabacteria bacterium]
MIWRSIITLFSKDISIELRTRETLSVQATMSLILGVICSIGAHSAMLSPSEILTVFPILIWFTFLFSSALAVAKGFEYEKDNDAITGIILTGVDPSLIYLSKVTATLFTTILGHILALIVFSLLLNIGILPYIVPFLAVSILCAIGYCSISCLLTPVALSSRLRGAMLPLISLPLMFPILFSAVETTIEIFIDHTFSWSSVWVSILLIFDVIYLTAGINLFEKVVKE